MLRAAGATRGYQWHFADSLDRCQLFEIVSISHTILIHAIEYHLTCTQLLRFANPVCCFMRGFTDAARVSRISIHPPGAVDPATVNAKYDAL
jgi:hypothetical protein